MKLDSKIFHNSAKHQESTLTSNIDSDLSKLKYSRPRDRLNHFATAEEKKSHLNINNLLKKLGYM